MDLAILSNQEFEPLSEKVNQLNILRQVEKHSLVRTIGDIQAMAQGSLSLPALNSRIDPVVRREHLDELANDLDKQISYWSSTHQKLVMRLEKNIFSRRSLEKEIEIMIGVIENLLSRLKVSQGLDADKILWHSMMNEKSQLETLRKKIRTQIHGSLLDIEILKDFRALDPLIRRKIEVEHIQDRLDAEMDARFSLETRQLIERVKNKP